jgi:mRNA-degrading endonuclease RelE of RelBE toxin-antitoxin system
MDITLKQSAIDDLKRLTANFERRRKLLDSFVKKINTGKYERLTGDRLGSLCKARSGPCRAVFAIEGKDRAIIIHVGDRKEIYKELQR